MLVFNEGVPRAGKSYDAVKNHILPALKKRRRVYARLNGLQHDKIADYLKMSREEVRDLLHVVETKDVADTFVCTRDQDTGQWVIPDEFKDSLIVIDEVHEFYVNERMPLPPQVENFFALLGQNGGDAVIMTQWIQRLHSAVKARIEKKHSFQKLSAVGMEGSYLVTYYQTIAAGKFEKIGSEKKKYDPAIFSLYHGYAPGAENVEVYKEGGKTVWAALAVKGVFFLLIAVVGGIVFVNFFLSGNNAEADKKAKTTAYVERPSQSSTPVANAPKLPPPDPYRDMTPEQRYLIDLCEKGRIRLQARAEVAGEVKAWIEWIDTNGLPIESLDLDQIRALGWMVLPVPYGIRLKANDHVLIATAWPHQQPVRDTDQRLYNLSDTSAVAGVASAASDVGGGAGATSGGVISGRMGQMGSESTGAAKASF